MFAGHFGVAAAIKSKTPIVPLWAIIVSSQLIDIIFMPLFILGIETMDTVSSNGYGSNLIHANYSHSLVGTFILAVVVGLLASKLWSKNGGIVIGFTIFSHWLLDLIVHRPDLPILPGNLGGLPLLGFGLWEFKIASIILEAILITMGLIFYTRSIVSKNKGRKKGLTILSSSALGLIMILSLITDVIG